MTFNEWCFRLDLLLEKEGILHRTKNLDVVALKGAFNQGMPPADFVKYAHLYAIAPRLPGRRTLGGSQVKNILVMVVSILIFAGAIYMGDKWIAANSQPSIAPVSSPLPNVKVEGEITPPTKAKPIGTFKTRAVEDVKIRSKADIYDGMMLESTTYQGVVEQLGEPSSRVTLQLGDGIAMRCQWIDREDDSVTLVFQNGILVPQSN